MAENYYIGIDAGSVSVNAMVINRERKIVYEAPYKRHLGRVEEEVLALIRDLHERFGENQVAAVAFTGNHGQKVSERIGAFFEFETISQVLGALFPRAGHAHHHQYGRPGYRPLSNQSQPGELGTGILQYERALRLGNRILYRPAGPTPGHFHLQFGKKRVAGAD